MILATLLRAGFERAPGGYRRRPGAARIGAASGPKRLEALFCSTLRAAGVDARPRSFVALSLLKGPGAWCMGPVIEGTRYLLSIRETPRPFSVRALHLAEKSAIALARGWTLLHVPAELLRDPVRRALVAAEVAITVRRGLA